MNNNDFYENFYKNFIINQIQIVNKIHTEIRKKIRFEQIYKGYVLYNDIDEILNNVVSDILNEYNTSVDQAAKISEQEHMLDKVRIFEKMRSNVKSIQEHATNDDHDVLLRTPREIKKDVIKIIDDIESEMNL